MGHVRVWKLPWKHSFSFISDLWDPSPVEGCASSSAQAFSVLQGNKELRDGCRASGTVWVVVLEMHGCLLQAANPTPLIPHPTGKAKPGLRGSLAYFSQFSAQSLLPAEPWSCWRLPRQVCVVMETRNNSLCAIQRFFWLLIVLLQKKFGPRGRNCLCQKQILEL